MQRVRKALLRCLVGVSRCCRFAINLIGSGLPATTGSSLSSGLFQQGLRDCDVSG